MNRLSRRTALALTAAALAAPHAAFAQSAVALKVAGVPEDSITPALYALQAGLFKKNGLDVDLSAQRSGSAVSSGVAGGAYQIGKSSIVPLINAHVKNIPFVIVAGGGLSTVRNPIVGLLVKADSPIRRAADLNGKTISVSGLNDLYTLCTKEWMAKNGGDPESIKQIELPVNAVPEALELGRIDAGAVIEPVLTRALETKKLRSLGNPFDAIAATFLYTGWFAMAPWVQQNHSAVESFSKTMRTASAWVNGHHGETIELLSKFTSIDASVIRSMHRVEDATDLDPKLLQPVIEACARYKLIPASFDAKDMLAQGIG